MSVGANKKERSARDTTPKSQGKSLRNENNPKKERGEAWDWSISAVQLCPLLSGWKGLNHLLSISNEDYRDGEARLLSQVPSERMRGNRSKLHQ